MRSSRNAETKTRSKYPVLEWASNQNEKQVPRARVSFEVKRKVTNSDSWQRESTPCSGDLVSTLGCAPDVIVDEYSSTDDARILESDP